MQPTIPRFGPGTRSIEARLTIVVLLTLATACKGNRSLNSGENCPHDYGLRTYQQWRQQVALPYAATEGTVRRIKANYDHVGVGSSKSEVTSAFGPPDFEEENYPKEPNRPCVGYKFMYYFEKPAEITNEFNDKKIEVFFSPTGKVTWIVGNVGLAEKGSPALR